MTGKANLEVRPRFVNKGEIAKRLVAEYGDSPPEFILCSGDDFTDEGEIHRTMSYHGSTKVSNRHVPRSSRLEATGGPRLLCDCWC